MPNRILRDSALDSDRIAAVDEASEVLFYRLIMLADDFGRFDGRLAVIRARAFALRHKVTEHDISARLAKLSTAGLIFLYEVSGKPYICIPRFNQRQRAEKSKFPDPPDKCTSNDGQATDTRLTSAPVVVVGGVVEDGDVVTASSAKALSAGEPLNGNIVAYIPLNDGTEFGISAEQLSEFEKLYPAVDVKQTLNEIRGWNVANPSRRKTRRGVLSHVNSWLSKEQNRGPQGR